MSTFGRDATPAPARLTHDAAESLISARLDGPLDPAANRALLAHLATCPTCRAFAEQMEAMSRGLRELPHLPPSPTVSRQVRERIAAGQPWWSRFALATGSRVGGMQAAAAMLILLGAVAAVLLVRLIGADNGTARPPLPPISFTPTSSETAQIATSPVAPTNTPDKLALNDTPTPTRTPTPSATPKLINVQVTPTAEPTETVQAAEVPTETPQPTATNEPAPTDTPVPPTETATAEPSPSATATASPTESPTVEPTATATPRPTREPTQEPTVEPTEQPTEAPTATDEPAPTETPTTEPTAAPTDTEVPPTATETTVPTARPTKEPSATPTEQPTDEPTETPTAEPTETRTPRPTVEPTQTSTPAIIQSNRTPEGGQPVEETPVDETPVEEPPTEPPTEEPSAEPTEEPSEEATAEDTAQIQTTDTGEPTIGPVEPRETATPEAETEQTPEPSATSEDGTGAAEITAVDATAEPTVEPTEAPTDDTGSPLAQAEVLADFPAGAGATTGLHFAPNGTSFALEAGGTIVLAAPSGAILATFPGLAPLPSPGSDVVLFDDGQGGVAVWDRDSGQPRSITAQTRGEEQVVDTRVGWSERTLLYLRVFPANPGQAELHGATWDGNDDTVLWAGDLAPLVARPVVTQEGVWAVTASGWVRIGLDGSADDPVDNPWGEISDPVVTPFGSALAFVSGGQVVVVSAQNPWLALGEAIPGGDGGFAFSPTGEQLVVADGTGLAIYDLYGSLVGRADGAATAPGWSEDGIYFVDPTDPPTLRRIDPAALTTE